MVSETYGTTVDIPGDSVTVRSGGTVAISAAFATTVGLVGGMDTANGDATEGEVQTIQSTSDAETAFGEDSELAEQCSLAIQNGGGTIYAIGVSETQKTETFGSSSASSSGTLSNVPVMDPRVNTESIDVTDVTEGSPVDVKVVDSDSVSAPTEANTVNININTGEWAADDTSEYDFSYTYGDFQGAIQSLVTLVPRFIGVLSENTQVANDLLTELNNLDVGFEFMHAAVGTSPSIDPSTYTDSFDDRRLAVVAPSRAYVDSAETDMARTMGAVAGKQAGKALGDSTTAESLSGFTSLYYGNVQPFTPAQYATLVDKQVYPLKEDGGISIVKDMTTSSDPRFERIAWSEITDEAAEISHQISEGFIGRANTEENRTELEESHKTSYAEMVEDDLLDAYDVSVSEGANAQTVDVSVGIDVVDYMDNIKVDISVGDVVQFQGAA